MRLGGAEGEVVAVDEVLDTLEAGHQVVHLWSARRPSRWLRPTRRDPSSATTTGTTPSRHAAARSRPSTIITPPGARWAVIDATAARSPSGPSA